jgi:regulatory protein
MVIQQLKPSTRVKGRWLAVLEDGSILRLGEAEIADFALYTGRELTPEEGEALTQAVHRRTLREKALDLLARKPQSRRELERKLKEWGAAEEEEQAICQRLEELGYLNDARYASLVVEHYCAKGYGIHKLRDELYRRGIPRALWEEALDSVQTSDAAMDAFIAKRMAGRQGDREQLQKVSAALARRGYPWSQIRDALARWGAEWED